VKLRTRYHSVDSQLSRYRNTMCKSWGNSGKKVWNN